MMPWPFRKNDGASPVIGSDASIWMYTDCACVVINRDVLMLQFGLLLQPDGGKHGARGVHTMVMNLFTAKRMLDALELSARQHEAAFGPIRMDSVPVFEHPDAIPNVLDTLPTYTNFARFRGTPEELIADFGLNPEPTGTPARIPVSHSFVMGFPLVKRLSESMRRIIGQFENASGHIETDIKRRMRR